MSKDNTKALEKPLRIISPKLYQHIILEFKDYNIHSYDLLVNGIKEENGLRLILRFGENFTRKKTRLFTSRVLEKQKDELTDFIKAAAEYCKKVMIDDYFEKMAP